MVRTITWNCRHQGFTRRAQALADALARLEPDVLFLQELPWSAGPAFVDELGSRLGLSAVFQRPEPHQTLTWHGTAILARGPLTAISRGWAEGAPLPGLLEAATLTLGGHSVELWSVHIPNGTSYGWHKIFTLQGLHRVLEARPQTPRIIGGDFNCPIREEGDRVWTGAVGTTTLEPWGEWTDRFGNSGHDREWDRVEGRLFRGELPVRDVYRATHPLAPGVTEEGYSHLSKGRRCRYDHIFASDHFRVVGTPTYALELLDTDSLSDHAPLIAELEPR